MIERLVELGFTAAEARVYVALLRQPSATGYELAKAAGLQRPNTYAALSSLADADAVALVSDARPARYVAHPPSDVLGRIKRRTSDRVDSLVADLATLAAPAQARGFYPLHQREPIIDRVGSLVGEATSRVAVCCWADDLDWLGGPLRAASRSGCRVVVNVFGEAGDLEGAEIYRHEAPEKTVGGHLLTVAADFVTALVASLDEPVGAVYTDHPALVRVVEKLIRDETYLAAIYTEHADVLEQSFGPHLVNLRAKLLPADLAEELISVVGFGADDASGALTPPGTD